MTVRPHCHFDHTTCRWTICGDCYSNPHRGGLCPNAMAATLAATTPSFVRLADGTFAPVTLVQAPQREPLRLGGRTPSYLSSSLPALQ